MRQISPLRLTAIICAASGAILAQWAATFRGGISFREALFLSWLLFGAIFFLAGLAQWSRMALRSYGVSPGQPWGAPSLRTGPQASVARLPSCRRFPGRGVATPPEAPGQIGRAHV